MGRPETSSSTVPAFTSSPVSRGSFEARATSIPSGAAGAGTAKSPVRSSTAVNSIVSTSCPSSTRTVITLSSGSSVSSARWAGVRACAAKYQAVAVAPNSATASTPLRTWLFLSRIVNSTSAPKTRAGEGGVAGPVSRFGNGRSVVEADRLHPLLVGASEPSQRLVDRGASAAVESGAPLVRGGQALGAVDGFADESAAPQREPSGGGGVGLDGGADLGSRELGGRVGLQDLLDQGAVLAGEFGGHLAEEVVGVRVADVVL